MNSWKRLFGKSTLSKADNFKGKITDIEHTNSSIKAIVKTNREFNVEEFSNGFIRLDTGMSVNFKFSWAINLPTTNLDMVICGDKGGLSVNNETLYKNVGKYQAETKLKWFDNGEYKGVPFEQHRYMYDNILQTLAGDAEYLIQEHQNLEVAKIIECYYRSAELGREVRVEEILK